MRRKFGIFVCAVGALLLIYGLWNLNMNLSQYRPEKIENLQVVDSLSTMEKSAKAVYVLPNKDVGIGPTDARYELAIRVEYTNVKGNLSIDDYFVEYGSLPYEKLERLEWNSAQGLTGNGSVTFEIPPTCVGVHAILFTPDFTENPSIGIQIYTIRYESRPDNAQIMISLTASLIGTFLISLGITFMFFSDYLPSLSQIRRSNHFFQEGSKASEACRTHRKARALKCNQDPQRGYYVKQHNH